MRVQCVYIAIQQRALALPPFQEKDWYIHVDFTNCTLKDSSREAMGRVATCVLGLYTVSPFTAV